MSEQFKQVLAEIVTELEETMRYQGALEAALVHRGLLDAGETGQFLDAQNHRLTNARFLISRLPNQEAV